MNGPIFTTTNKSPNHQPNNHKHACPHCPRLFACPHNVLQHCRGQHSNLGYARVQCPVCPSDFSRPSSCYRHMRHAHEVDISPGQGRAGLAAPRQPVRRGVSSAGVQRGKQGGQKGRSGVGRLREERRAPGEVIVIDLREEAELHSEPQVEVDEMEAGFSAGPTFLMPVAGENAFDPNVLDWYIPCQHCYMIFDQQVELQAHQHNVHGMLFPELCSCFRCWEAKFNRIFGVSGVQHQEPQMLQMPPSIPQAMPQMVNDLDYFQNQQPMVMPNPVPHAFPEMISQTVPQMANTQYDFQGLQSMASMQEALLQTVQETALQALSHALLPAANSNDNFKESEMDAENDSGIGFGSVHSASPEQQLSNHEEAAAPAGGDDDGN